MSKKQTDSDKLTQFLNFIRDSSTNLDQQNLIVKECDKETQDLLHQIELGPCKDRQKFCTQLAHVRRKRRLAKDYIAIHEELVSQFNNPDGKKMLRSLEQILGTMRKNEREIAAQRAYRPRVRQDLTINTTEDNKK